MRIFLDSNVLVSALTARGLCVEVMQLTLKNHVLITALPVATKLKRVLEEKFGLPAEISLEFASLIEPEGEVVTSAERYPPPISDPDDGPILACALAGRADVFVTGDAELQDLGEIDGMPIISPRQLWERLSKQT